MSSQRLPVPGGDNGDWGDILNGFLEVSLANDGTLNSSTVTDTQVSSNAAINPTKIAGTAEVQSNKNQANGYAGLNGSSQVPIAFLPANIPISNLSVTGTASNSTYLRGDGSWSVPPSATITSVFGRTGAITAQAGDYTASQITGAEQTSNKGAASGYAPLNGSSQVPIANLPTGNTSTTVALGNDSRIVGAIQSGTSAGGDLSGTYPNPSVRGINGVTVSGTPSSGQVIAATTSTSASWSTIDVNILGTPSNPVSSASAARPTGLTVVYWQCPTQPTNWVSGDIWMDNS